MLLSIIIPSFQQGDLLREALKSIEQQKFKDYEVLVIDGGSRDNTSSVISEFSYLPVKFYSEEDKGIYDAMNKGIVASAGEYIYFMGCDDTLTSEQVLADVFSIPFITQNHVIYGDVLFKETGGRHRGEFSYFDIIKYNIGHQAIFTRKEVFDRLGHFDIRYKTYADWEFNMRWFVQSWVRRQYIPVIIANFSIAGFSSHCNDATFFIEIENIKRKYFSRLTRYLAENRHKTIPWRLSKFLTFERMVYLRRILGLNGSSL